MLTTVIELEFVALPDLPTDFPSAVEMGSLGNGFLLNMCDGSARLATWNGRAFVGGGQTIALDTVLGWAVLLRPLDASIFGTNLRCSFVERIAECF